jgi:Glyoxalase/Bleomycin resistance protein/Dioxygenase superfamily
MSLSEMYHVGIVVADFEAGLAHFTDLLGIVWGPVITTEVAVRDGAGNDGVMPLHMCYSTQAPYLELIEECEGTPWVCNEHSNLHHIGFFTDDLVADSGHLTQARCPLELSGREGDSAPTSFTYHRDPLRVRIEYVDAATRQAMEAFMFTPPTGAG